MFPPGCFLAFFTGISCNESSADDLEAVTLVLLKSASSNLCYMFIDFAMFPCGLDFQFDQVTHQIFSFSYFFNKGIPSHSISVAFGPAFLQMFGVNMPIHNMFNDTSFCRYCWFLKIN